MHRHRCGTTVGVAVLVTFLMLLAGGCGEDGGGPEPVPNQPPQGSVVYTAGLRSVVEGESVSLEISASDPDFDTLTYAWTASPAGAGTFDDPTAASVLWTPGTARGEVTVSCTISDGTDEVTVSTAPGVLVIGTSIEGGTLAADATWTAANSPYVVLDDFTVAATVTLTLEAGTTVHLRPTQVGANDWSRPVFMVAGTLLANGSVGGGESEVRFLGGRGDGQPEGAQHGGLSFFGDGEGTLTYTRIREGDSGVSQQGSGALRLEFGYLEQNSVGMSMAAGSSAELVDCQVSDNSIGIAVSGASLTMSATSTGGSSRVEDNRGAGISITSPSNQFASVTVTGTVFNANDSGHLRLDSAFGFIQVAVTCSDFASVPDGQDKIVTADCILTSLELRGNNWGGTFTTPAEILALFAGGRDCGADVSTWELAADDWFNGTALGNCPPQ